MMGSGMIWSRQFCGRLEFFFFSKTVLGGAANEGVRPARNCYSGPVAVLMRKVYVNKSCVNGNHLSKVNVWNCSVRRI